MARQGRGTARKKTRATRAVRLTRASKARPAGGNGVAPQERVAQYPRRQVAQRIESPGLESELDPRPQFEAPAYRPAGKLHGRKALITGGDSGIGRAVTVLFAREGADVAIVYMKEEQSDAEETQRNAEAAGRRCILIPGDVTSPRFCREAVRRAHRELGGLDLLVNNAAFQESVDQLEDISDEQWDRTFRTNIHAYFWVTKAALQYLKPGSAIINTGSVTGLQGSAKLLDYSATKGAIHTFTKSLAQSLVERGIRVNCVAPGPVWTPLNPADGGRSPEDIATFGTDQPMHRAAQPEEMAPAYVFFASEADSSYVTGEVLAELGGETTAG